MRGVVDHHAAGRRRTRRMLGRDRTAGGEKRDIRVREIELVQILDGQLTAAEVDFLAGGAAARQGDDFTDREIAFRQDRQHYFADGTGGTHDRYIVSLRHETVSSIPCRSGLIPDMNSVIPTRSPRAPGGRGRHASSAATTASPIAAVETAAPPPAISAVRVPAAITPATARSTRSAIPASSSV